MTKRLTKQRYLNQSRKSYFIFVPSMFILYLFDGEIYIQCDRVAMGSPLGSLLEHFYDCFGRADFTIIEEWHYQLEKICG